MECESKSYINFILVNRIVVLILHLSTIRYVYIQNFMLLRFIASVVSSDSILTIQEPEQQHFTKGNNTTMQSSAPISCEGTQ